MFLLSLHSQNGKRDGKVGSSFGDVLLVRSSLEIKVFEKKIWWNEKGSYLCTPLQKQRNERVTKSSLNSNKMRV